MTWDVFDRQAGRYDAWFDSAAGSRLFAAELECLASLLPSDVSGWTEVGVGTGRFAAALGISKGVDPSPPMLKKAEERGISTEEAQAEQLPYESDSVAGILLVVTLCFLDQPEAALRECVRVLKPGGKLLAGIVPAESSWGQFYQEKGNAEHPFYSVARFYTCRETKELASNAGLELVSAASTLPMPPGENVANIRVRDGARESFGFAAMMFRMRDGNKPPQSEQV